MNLLWLCNPLLIPRFGLCEKKKKILLTVIVLGWVKKKKQKKISIIFGPGPLELRY
jgi:hypothetical protein